jgi:CRISPR system Cascade subunit CasC
MGGVTRLRVSSQSLKRAWRTSDVFEAALQGTIGTRTKEMGIKIYKTLTTKGIEHKKAMEWAGAIAAVFGKRKNLSKADKDKLKDLPAEERLRKELIELEIEQLAHFGPAEETAISTLVEKLVNSNEGPDAADLQLLRAKTGAADIALFGRMLASSPAFNMEAAAQIAHAVTVHKVAVEDDFFTAVDDLNVGEEDKGAGHMGETEYGSGIFYLYICLDRQLLLDNLSGDKTLADQTIAALIESAATVSPTGKQNSFASRARASYILCETGSQQPRSLSVAFLEPIAGKRMLTDSITVLRETRDKMNAVYGDCSSNHCELNAHTGEGSIREIIKQATE